MEQLTTVDVHDAQTFQERFRLMKSIPHTYFVVVAEDVKLKRIVGSASIIVEAKFIRSCGKVSLTPTSRKHNL